MIIYAELLCDPWTLSKKWQAGVWLRSTLLSNTDQNEGIELSTQSKGTGAVAADASLDHTGTSGARLELQS
jgi:hypothetical protein